MNDLIIAPNGSGWIAIIPLIRTIAWSCPSSARVRFWLSAAKRTDKQIGRSEGAGPNRPFRRRSGARRSARPLDLRAGDDGGLAPAARIDVAERERVVGVELSVPEAVGVGEDEAPVVLAGQLADEWFVGLLPAD